VFPHESICPGVRSVNNRELKEFRLNYMLRKLGMGLHVEMIDFQPLGFDLDWTLGFF
jgi:hypothetical protein